MKPGFDYTGLFAVFVCHDGKGKFLMSKRGSGARDEQGTWEFGGGGIEFGEAPEEAVRRELSEEYGCKTVYDIKPLPSFSLIRSQHGQQTHWIGFPFVISINPDEIRITETDAVERVEWFDFENLPEPLHPGAHKVIAAYKVHLGME